MNVRRLIVLRVLVGTLIPLLCDRADIALGGFGPVGVPFQVNTYTTNDQSYPSLAADDAGGFIVVWESKSQDGSLGGVYAQRFDSANQTIGGEFRVNAYTTSDQRFPSVAFNGVVGNSFLVTWDDARATPADVYGNAIIGTATLPIDVLMNTFTADLQQISSVAILADGGGIVTWASRNQDGDGDGVYAQRRSSTGVPVGTEFRVNSYTTGWQNEVDVAALPDGGFVIVWEGRGPALSNYNVWGQRYSSTGTLVGTEFRVNTSTSSNQVSPDVAVDGAGGFIVVWSDGAATTVSGQRFDSGGAPAGTEFVVGASTTDFQYGASVAAAPDGQFVVVWTSTNLTDEDTLGRHYDSSGAPSGVPFAIAGNTTIDEQWSSVAADSIGGFIVAWRSDDASSSYGVFAQRIGERRCAPTPAAGCRAPGKSLLLVKNDGDDSKDKVTWKWLQGALTDVTAFGAPLTGDGYALCVYDAGGQKLAMEVEPGPEWAATGSVGFKFQTDGTGGDDGISKIKLKAGLGGKAKLLVKGAGVDLPIEDAPPTLPLTPPVTAQVINDQGECWSATYATAIKNDGGLFKAK